MYGGGKAHFRYSYLLTMTIIVYVGPLNGDMCSTMVAVYEGEDSTALQEKAFANFKSTCRNSQSGTTVNDVSPCYGPLQTLGGYPLIRYPRAGFFSTHLQRLEFSVQSTNNVFLDLKDASSTLISVELGGTSRIEMSQAGQPGSHYVNLSDVTRFWVTYINGKIRVGMHGEEAPFMENNDSNINGIKYIIFDSDAVAEWLIYMPCNVA